MNNQGLSKTLTGNKTFGDTLQFKGLGAKLLVYLKKTVIFVKYYYNRKCLSYILIHLKK